MAQVCLKINLERLRRRLSQQQMRELTDAEVHRWLNDNGLKMTGDGWLCDGEESVRCLREDEVLQKVSTTTVDGVTFVDTTRYP